MASPRRRKPKRRVWGWLPDKGELGKLLALLTALGLWWDARHNPDPRTAAVASLAVTGAETDVHLAERLDSLASRMGRLEARIKRVEGGGRRGAPAETLPATAQPEQPLTGWRGFLQRWMGHKDRR